MDRVKYLINWTQETDNTGGTERRYSSLQKAFPNAVLISANEISGEKYSISKRRIAVDEFLKNNTTPDDIVIKDAGVGGLCSIPAKKVLLFGNPYQSLVDTFRRKVNPFYWQKLITAQRKDVSDSVLNIANSNFSKFDAEINKVNIHKVIPNGVDIDFWKPSRKVKKKHVLWVGSEFKNEYSFIKIDQLMARIPVKFVKIYKSSNYSNKEMLRAYQEAFCLVHFFPVEGNSNAVLEAIACDIPVISTKSGLFWDTDISQVGFFWPEKTRGQMRVIGKALNGPKLNPRDTLIKSKLTEKDYIKNMQEAVKCIL